MLSNQAEKTTSEPQPAPKPLPGAGSHLDRMAALCQTLAILFSALAACSWLLVLPPLQALLPGSAPSVFSISLSILVLSLTLVRITHGANAGRRGQVLAAVLFAVVLATAAALDLLSGRAISLDSLLGQMLFPDQYNPSVPLSAGVVLPPLMVAIAEILLLQPADRRRSKGIAAALGALVMVIGAIVCLGYVFSVPLLYGGRDLRVTLITGAALFFLGGALIAAGGPATFLTRNVVGRSLQARLLRVFLPLAAGIALAQSLFHVFISSTVPDHAFGVAITAVLFLFVTGIAVGLAGRSIGLEFDAALDQRQRAETAARLTAAKYQSLFEVESDALFLIDQETGGILEANAAASQLYGYSHQELLAMHHLDLTARPGQMSVPLDDPGSAAPVRHHRRRDGSVIPVEISSSQMAWDGRQVRLVAIRDVTERQRAQQALRDSETRFRAIFDHSVDAISVSVAGKHRYVNAAYLRLFGAGPGEDLAGQPILESIAPSQRQEVAGFTYARTNGLPAPSAYETTGLRRDGSEFLAEVHVSTFPLRTETYTMAVLRDITERKQAADSLCQTNIRMERTLASLDEVVLVLDPLTRRVLTCSPAVERIFGYRPDELIGHTTEMLHPDPESFVAFKRQRRASIDPDGIARIEWQMRRKDGSVFPSEHTVAEMQVQPGQPAGLVSVIRDITERKRSEAALRESQRAMATLLTNLPGMAYRCLNDRDRTMKFVSQGCQTVTGYPAEDLTDNARIAFNGLIHGDDREQVWQQIQAALEARKPYELLYRIVTTSETPKWVWEQGTGIFREDGSLTALEGFIADVTERERAQADLRRTSAMLASTLANLDEVVLVVDAETREILTCNAATERTLGYPPTELIGQRTQLVHVSPEASAEFRRLRHAIAPAGAPARLEWRLRRKDGTIFHSEHTLSEISDGPWDRPVTVSVIRDISLRKQAEEQMATSLREKEVLLREIHHRVKNNLQVIASLLSLQMQTLQDSVAVEALRDSQSRIKAMSLIHAKLYESRDLARIDFGGFVRDLGAVLLRSYLANPATVQLRVSAGSTELDIDNVIPCSLIVNELLANCVRHAFPDGRAGHISVDMSQEGDCYTLRVADNGIGFPPGLDFRNTSSLGLQLVNMLTGQLEGTVEMNQHDGTEFVIVFKSRPPRAS